MTIPLFVRGAMFFPLLWLGACFMPSSVQAVTLEEVQQVVTGTLVKLDLSVARGVLTTDVGDPIQFDIPKPELFERLSLGSRVTIAMNKAGGADRVTGASMADIVLSPNNEP
jgi:hypothetical protein